MERIPVTPQQGWKVIGSDGEKLGEIETVEQDYIVVRKGFLFPSDHHIPFGAIAASEEGAVYLNVSKDQALNQEWESPHSDDAPHRDVDASHTDAYRDDAAHNPGWTVNVVKEPASRERTEEINEHGYVTALDREERENLAAASESGFIANVDEDAAYVEDEVVAGDLPTSEAGYTTDLHGDHEQYLGDVEEESEDDDRSLLKKAVDSINPDKQGPIDQ